MKIYETFLIKDHSLLIEKNTNLFQLIGGNRIFKNKVVRKNTKQPNNQEIVHHISQD